MLEDNTFDKNRQHSDANISECDKRTYTVNEIQEILSISQPTAYALIKKGEFRSIRVGRHIRVSKASFDAWLDERL